MELKNRVTRLLVWGGLIAAAALLLQWLEYQYVLRRYSTETYIVVLCLLFTVLGTWFGKNLIVPPRRTDPFLPNEKALQALGLSSREIEVLTLLSEGNSNSELAAKLHVSVNTVKTHLQRVYEKLGVSHRGQAISKARQLQLVP